MKYFWLIAALFAGQAYAYTSQELRGDCLAAETFYAHKKSTDPFEAVRSARCIGYVAGFIDGYAVSDHLAETIGVKLNAFCLPRDSDLPPRLVRSVLAHLDHLPPNTTADTATIVAGALAKTFPCADSLEPKK